MVISIYRALLVSVLLSGCMKISVDGDTTHRVEGEATTRIIVSVDTAICDELDAEAKQECIKALIELAIEAAKKEQPTKETI